MPQIPMPKPPLEKKWIIIEADVDKVEEALLIAEAMSKDSSYNYTINLNRSGKLTVRRVTESEWVEYLKLDV